MSVSSVCRLHGCVDYKVWWRNFPLFPSVRGATLLKKHVITAYRTVIHKAGVVTTTTDGLGNVRQRFGGHICRVVGAVIPDIEGIELGAIVLPNTMERQQKERYQVMYSKQLLPMSSPAFSEKQAELWRAMEVRLNLLEGSVGDGAPCVRNFGKFQIH